MIGIYFLISVDTFLEEFAQRNSDVDMLKQGLGTFVMLADCSPY